MKTRTLMTTAAPLSALLFLAGTTLGQTGNPADPDRPARDMRQVDQTPMTAFTLAKDIRGKEIFNRQDEQIGTVSDLVIDMRSGRAKYAVVSFGGWLGIDSESVAVPISALSWHRSKERFLLPTTKEQVEAAPKFDSENWDQLDNRDWQDRTRRAFGDQPRDRDDLNPTDALDTNNSMYNRWMLSTDLADATVRGSDDRALSGIEDIVIDRNSGYIGFVTLETGGILGVGSETHIIPWEALKRSENNRFTVALNEKTVKDAPKIRNDGIAELSNRELNSEIYAFYNVKPRHNFDASNSGRAGSATYASAASLIGSDVVDRQGEQLGEVTDIVVLARTGTAQYAVVSYGGLAGVGAESVAVPMNALSWDRSEDRFVLPTTRDRLESAPSIDPENWNLLDDESWRNQTRGIFGNIPQLDRNTDRLEGSDDRTGRQFGKYAAVSDLRGLTLVSSDGEEIGSVQDLILDRRNGHIGFMTMETGGVLGIGADTVVVPWEAARRVQEDQLRVSMTSVQLKQAPRIQTDRIGDLNDAEYAQEIYGFYQVKPRKPSVDNRRDTSDNRDRDPGSRR